jgi:phage terminase large subunit-like protein
MGKPSKYTDEEWDAAFEREKAGERRSALARELGVSISTMHWQASKRGIKRGVTPGWVDHRRRPEGGWPEDYVFPQSRSGMSTRRWRELLARYVAGEPIEVLAGEYGVSESAIMVRARDLEMRKIDHPDSVYQPRGPMAAAVGVGAATAGRAGLAFAYDPDDPTATGEALTALEVAAAGDGRAADFLTLRRVRRAAGLEPEEDAWAEADAGPAPEPVALRQAQEPPRGDWTTWLFLGGRGAGKTLAGAMWLSDMAEALGPRGRLALIGPTLHDVREVMIDGVSGIVGLERWWGGKRPVFEPSRRRLTFPNGATAYAFSAEDPDSLRGPQFGAAWADEFCAWPRTRGGPGETLALLRMGLRLGARPRLLVTTTPKPIAGLRALRGEAGVEETHAATRDNAAHLSAGFVEGLERLYGGTRKAEQELEGRVVEVDGALFTAEMLARARMGEASGSSSPKGGSPYERVVVAVDPTTTASGNACGIVVAGRSRLRGNDDVEYVHVLADRSAAGLGPDGWARRAVRAAEEFGAAAIVAEVNQGGEMVRAVLKTAGCVVRIREVRATKGKRVRAEPVAALYEQGRVTHAAGLGALEEELMAFGGEDEALYDLDRADALVWAVTDLLIDRAGSGERGPRISFV